MAEQQTDIYEYGLNIILVKMSVKFPCKMKLEYNGSGITSEASPSEGQKFVFNQQVSFKEESSKPYFQISVNLITEKGGKYIAGILKIFHNQLSRSEGQRIVVPLAKCLDSEAFCQLRVDQVHVTKQTRKPVLHRSRVADHQNDYGSGQKHKTTFLGGDTKSQFQYPANSRKPKNDWEDIRSRHNAAQSYYNRNMARSPNRSPTKLRSPFEGRNQHRPDYPRHGSQFPDGEHKDKFIEAQVYKEGYNKLKEKYKKQAENAKNQLNKRIGLENAENNLKLQIMRLKLRSEEQEKAIIEKNGKNKDLQSQISLYQKKQLDMGYVREEINNKEHTIRMLEENIRTLTRDNDELKTINSQRTISEQEKTKQLKRELELFRQRAEAKENDLERDLKAKSELLFGKQADLHSKTQLLNRQKKNSEELERESQNKTLDFEKMLQNEKANSRSRADELKAKIQKLEKNLSYMQNQKNDLQVQLERTKSIQVKIEYENRVLMQDADSMKTELAGMKAYKDKYSQIFRDHKLLLDDKNHLQKQLERALQSKQLSTTELSKQHMQQVDYFRRTNKELDQKQRSLANKTIELEGLLEAARSSQEKFKRGLEAANGELSEIRDKEKHLKKTLKVKEQEAMGLENDLSSAKQKNKSSEHFFRHEIEKYKEELDKVKSDFESQSIRSAQLNEQNGQLSVQLGKLKVKLQFTEEKVEKDASDMREKKLEIQGIIRDYEAQLSALNDTVQNLRNYQKELIGKLQKQEIEGLKSQERIDRMTKEIKILDEKHSFAENLLKNRQSQSSVLQTGKKDLELRSYKLQEELSALKGQQSQLIAERNKNKKMIQLMQQENGKLRKENEKIKQLVDEKERLVEELYADLKKIKEELTRTDMKLNSVSKDFERFKETTAQGLNNSFSVLLADRKQLQHQFTSSSITPTNPSKRPNELQPTTQSPIQINNLILTYSRQTKVALSKLTQQNRQLIRQNQKLQDQLAGNINRGQTSEYQYSQQIQEVEAELASSYQVRDQEGIKFDHILKDLNARIRDKDREIGDLGAQIDDMNFTISSSKVQNDNGVEQQTKKAAMLKSRILELEEKVEFLSMDIMSMEEKIHEQEMECEGVKGALRVERENGARKERIIMQLQEYRDQLQQELEEGKRYRKDLLEKNSTLELLLNTQREQLEKHRQLLDDQQQKAMELKTFIGSLMKQKEGIIKNQLEKSEQLISLEGTILELTRDRDIFSEEASQLAKQLQESKETGKKFGISIKGLQAKLTEEKGRHQKTTDKLKEKEKELIGKQETVEKLDAKVTRLTERGQKEGNQLRDQLQAKTEQLLALTKESSHKTFQFEKDRHGYQAQTSHLKNQLMNMQEQMFNLKHGHETRLDQINSLNGELAQQRLKLENMQMVNNDLGQEIREKQETAFQISGKVYNLEMKLEAREVEKNEKMGALDNDWICKYEGICEEYEQRVELVEKERDYYKERMQDQEDELKKLTNQRNMLEIEEGKFKGILEEKIKQLEDDRLRLISQKNAELQKVTEDSRANFQALKARQSENRRILHELEVSRSTASKFQLKNKEMQEKMKNISRVYTAEIQQLKKKEALHKNFKEAVSNKIWSSEREVRRVVQACVKRVMESLEDQRNAHRLIQVMKGFQQNVADAMRISIDDLR